MYAAILAGGVGTRLWPLSRQACPKQFTDITGSGRTMLQATADRLDGLVDPDRLYIMTGAPYAELVADQLPALPAKNILVEPIGRNTGPAIGLACIHIKQCDPNGVVAILHSDHVILDTIRFQAALSRATDAARAGYLVTLGIQPTSAHTGYGYIKCADALEILPSAELPVFSAQSFLEKPDRTTAESFLIEGDYYWNGGIFVSRVDRMLEEFERQMPEVYACLEEIERGLSGVDRQVAGAILDSAWESMPSISIDRGVMEGAKSVAVVPLQAGWNDIGSWDALDAILHRNETNNLVVKGDILALESDNNIVYSDGSVIALIGVNDLVIVSTGDTLLIGHKRQMQNVREIVERLRLQGRMELL